MTKTEGCLLAASGGFALFLADYPASQPWLAFVAFAPLFWTVLRAGSVARACALGAAWGAARLLPMAWMLHGFGLPWLARLLVVGYVLLLDAAFSHACFGCARRRPGCCWRASRSP